MGGAPQFNYSNVQPVAAPYSMPPGTFCYGQGVPPRCDGQYVWSPTGVGQLQKNAASKSHQQKNAAKVPTSGQKVKEADDEAPKDTLRTNLRDLSNLEAERVLLVRKINRLGLDSAAILKAHFSQFGEVDRIMVSHSRAKSIFGRGEARVRPAGLGFLLMTKPEDVEAVLRAGEEHVIEGATIWCSRFEPREASSLWTA
jgi:RNA recognition motif-containing protein